MYRCTSATKFHHTVNTSSGTFHDIRRQFNLFTTTAFQAIINVHQCSDLHIHAGKLHRQWIKLFIRAVKL